MGPISISVGSSEEVPEWRQIQDGLRSYNVSKVGEPGHKALLVCARDQQENLLGGLLGYTDWHWLSVEKLWVSELHRGRGLGKLLLFAAENEAVKRGCRHARLDTFGFQAPGFYEKLGYAEWGRLEDCPVPGQTRHFYQKRNLET